jgi:hypothetical protein
VTTEQIIELIGQIIGFVAIGVAFLSFQVKNKNGILAIQALANFIWAIHFYMIGAMAGCVLNLVATGRNLVFAMRDKYKWLGGIWLPTLIAAIVATLSITTRESWFDVILLPSTILSTYTYCLGNERVIRNSSVFVSLTWLIFNIVSFSISGVIAEVFNLTSLTIAIIRFRKQGKEIEEIHANEKNAATNTESSKENA